jgi:hypothetical protein
MEPGQRRFQRAPARYLDIPRAWRYSSPRDGLMGWESGS